jgi:coenzyme Q-binding protein COQ10
MPSFKTSRRVRHSAGEMFALVADVDRYPEFVPLCRALRVRRRTQTAEGVEVLLADMEVGYRAIRERFTSRVTLNRPRLEILVEYVDGPFSHMENVWSFIDEPATSAAAQPASRVEFFISYQFRSRMLGALMGAMFEAAFRKFASAFEAQADAVYAAKTGIRIP